MDPNLTVQYRPSGLRSLLLADSINDSEKNVGYKIKCEFFLQISPILCSLYGGRAGMNYYPDLCVCVD